MRSLMRAMAVAFLGMVLGAGCSGESKGLVLIEARALPDAPPIARVSIRVGDGVYVVAEESFLGDLPRMTEPRRLGVYVSGSLEGTILVVVSGLDAAGCEVARGTATAGLRSGKTATVPVVAMALRTDCSDGGVLVRADVRPPAPRDAVVSMADAPGMADGAAGAPDGIMRDAAVDVSIVAVDMGTPVLMRDAGIDVRADVAAVDAAGGRDVGAADVPVDAPAPVDAAMASADLRPSADLTAAVDMAPPNIPADVAPDVAPDQAENEPDAEPDAQEAEADMAPVIDMAPDSTPDSAAVGCDEITQTGCSGTAMCAFGCNTITRIGDFQCVAPGIKVTGDTCTSTAQCGPGNHCGCLSANDCRCMKYCRTGADCLVDGTAVAQPGTNGVCQYRIACSGDPSSMPKAVLLCGRAP